MKNLELNQMENIEGVDGASCAFAGGALFLGVVASLIFMPVAPLAIALVSGSQLLSATAFSMNCGPNF